MPDDSNKKRIREQNKKKRDYLKATKVEMKQEIVKTSTDKKGNIKEETETVTKVYPSGTAVFAEFFNTMAEEANRKALKEADKPKYRFYESAVKKYPPDDVIDAISEIETELRTLGFEVEIIEKLDVKDVTDEKRYLIRVCSSNGIYSDVSLLEYREAINDFSFQPEDFFQKEIAKITGGIDDAVRKAARLVVKLLSYTMYFRVLNTLRYDRIGWSKYDWDETTYIFKYDTVITNLPFAKGRGNQKYVDGLQRSTNPNGKEKWMKAAMEILNKHPLDCLILGAGVSGLVRGYLPYTKESNINVNIQGEPACGKSTICHFVLSVFGNPEKLEGSFTDTDNSMEEIRVRRPVLPYVLDERMLKSNGEVKDKSSTLIKDIFREYEGKVKERLGKQYEEMSGERTYGPVISSSVDSMMEVVLDCNKDLGQFRRFLEFEVGETEDTQLFSDAEEAKKIETTAYTHYGFGVRIIVEYMLNLITYGVAGSSGIDFTDEEEDVRNKIYQTDPIQLGFHLVDKKIQKRLEETEKEEELVGLQSSSKRFAMIVYSYQIFREALLYEVETQHYMDEENEDKENWQRAEQKYMEENAKEYAGVIKEASDNLVNAIKDFKEIFYRGGCSLSENEKSVIELGMISFKNVIMEILNDIHKLSKNEIIQKINNECEKLKKQLKDMRNIKEDNEELSEECQINEKKNVIQKMIFDLLDAIENSDSKVRENVSTKLESGIHVDNKKENKSVILADYTEEVINILIKNLVIKMRDVKIRTIPQYVLYDYFVENQKYFYECKNYNTGWNEANNYKYIGKYIKRDNGIELILRKSCGLSEILFSTQIAKPEDILKYMELFDVYHKDAGKQDTVEMKKYLKKLKAVSEKDVKKYCSIYNIAVKSTNAVFIEGEKAQRMVRYILPTVKVKNEEKEVENK